MTGVPDQLRGALRLMVITHPHPGCRRPLAEVVEAVVAAGAGAIQLRDKEAPPRKLLGLARRLRAVTARHGALLIVNDRLDVALAAGADGVHLGPDDVPVAAARRVVPGGFLLGHSTDDPRVARRAEADGADYLGCGTVFPTASKEDAGAVIGVGGLAAVARSVHIPVLAIGGVTADRTPLLDGSGAGGVAVISAVMAADRPANATRRLREAVEGWG
ncbi:MAG: thiamine phosphate synthase [Gammaproteobacteria bacterium]|nr:thiamine phosphate synthase [Gammaproteobacteria bacterium]